ncbi:serine threonine kinase [Trichoderma arundinaceum]|uniref:Serine threonine kinase n=1 Tax=Trichoderma arundinaceum TaxID=490622 RepID=A0A395P047_TRIAR|nr:serine threonine kinase [Trichoderma arundinaceum]
MSFPREESTLPNSNIPSQPESSSKTQIEPRVAAATAALAAGELTELLVGDNQSSLSKSSSETQIEPRIEAAVEALAAGELTGLPGDNQSSSSSSSTATQIEPRVSAAVATLEARQEAEAAEIEEVTSILTNASPSFPNARLVVASFHYLNKEDTDTKESAVTRLERPVGGRNILGVTQRTHDVDFIIKLPLDLIQHGMWRVFIHGDGDGGGDCDGDEINAKEHYLVDFLLISRQFSVAIHGAGPQAKRAAGDEVEANEKPAKRQRLGKGVAQATAAQATKPPAELEPVAADTSTSVLPPPREIVNKAANPILELVDGELAVIRTPQVDKATSQANHTAREQPSYQLQRINHVGVTRSTCVFTCQRFEIPKVVVAKVLRYNGKSAHNLRNFAALWKREKSILEKLDHTNIVSLIAFDGRMLALYLESLPPNLFTGIKSQFQPSDAFKILHDTSSALAYLATQHIVHNDIKPLNITYSSARGAVILDFGMAVSDTASYYQTGGGTPWYIPPDLVIQKTRGLPGDVWALGVTMLYVLGRIDFPERTCKGWPIHNLLSPQSAARKQMDDWLHIIAQKRADLDHGDKTEQLVFQMLEIDGPLRIEARDINLALKTRKIA